MLKSELIQKMIDTVSANFPDLTEKAITESTQEIIKTIAESLEHGGRMEVRGFGSLDVVYCPSRKARDPRTGETVLMSERHKVVFKSSKKLRLRLNSSYR